MFYIFNNIKEKYIFDSVLKAKLTNDNSDIFTAISNLVSFSTKWKLTGNLWQKYLLYTLIHNDNPYTRAIEKNQKVSGDDSLIMHDLRVYYDLYNLDIDFMSEIKNYTFLKETGSHYVRDLLNEMEIKLAENTFSNFKNVILSFYKTNGLSDMAIYKAFRVNDGVLIPIKHVLEITFDDLIGYDEHKRILCENTEAFINNRPYNNVLLYGDAGTGKSSSIKALINKYFDKGLRIIEVYKHQMKEISKIIDTLKSRPYYYVIYMDDLSFEENEIEYKYLKSIIEGGIEPKPNNVVIYATSNRRHLIKETFKDNGDIFDDLHRNETEAEKLSLAYRFGIKIYYSSLSPKEFKDMVVELARRNEINIDIEILLREANIFEMNNGTLSGRCATQFINYIYNKYM